MKRTFANKSLLSHVAGFFLFGFLMLSAARADAQTYNWMGTDQARQTLLTEVTSVQNDLQQQTPGSQGYNNLLAHAYYYKEIYRNIDSGKTVEKSVNDALNIFTDNPGGASVTSATLVTDLTITKPQKAALRDDAIDLLTL